MLLIRGDRNLCLVWEVFWKHGNKFSWQCALRCDAYTVEFFRIFEHMQFRNRLQGVALEIHVTPCISMHSVSFNLSSAQEVTRMLHHPHQRKTCETHSDSTSDVSSSLAFKVVMCRCGQAVWTSNGKSKFKGRKIQKPHVYSIQYDIRPEQRIQVAERTVKKEGLALLLFCSMKHGIIVLASSNISQ